jgi:hypothetical protein
MSSARLDPKTVDFIRMLARGDGWMNYWTKETPTIWWKTNPPPMPAWAAVYFSVNPRFTRMSGYKRGGNDDVCTVNCLYADFDHIQPDQLTPAVKPTATVSSGGGVHGYWIFYQPVKITDENDLQVMDLQRRWVSFIKADPAACDLARVLRLPGSLNKKYTPARAVELVEFDPTRLYDIGELAGMIPTEEKTPQDGGTFKGIGYQPGNMEGFFSHALDMARDRGRNAAGLWLACQARDGGLTPTEAYNLLDRFRQVVTTWKEHEYTRQEIRDTLKGAFSRARRAPAEKV